jgi:hypothetical protein
LGTTIRGDGVRNTKTGNPSGTEGISTGVGGRGMKRNSLNPTGGAINDGENVGMALRGRKGSYQVNMNVGETTGRDRNRSRRRGNVFVNFGSLAGNTLLGPEGDVTGHAIPKEAGSDQATGGFDTGMT